MAPPVFPYQYPVVHPFLHMPEKFHWFKSPMRLVSLVTGVVLGPIKLIVVAIAMGLGGFLQTLLDKTTHDDLPLRGWRRALYRLIVVIFWRITIHAQFLVLVRRNKSKFNPAAHVIVSNHQNMNDVVIHGMLHFPVYLARSDMIGAYGIGPVLKTSRSLLVDKHKSNDGLVAEMRERAVNETLQIFPEGTISAQHCVIRSRPGAFKAGQLIQPIAIRYRTFLPCAWLTESGIKHLLDLSMNLFGIIEYIYLDVIENETPDQLGKRMADALDVPYLPYTNCDYLYFCGKTDSTERCSPEYLKDFGWMGQVKDYKAMCKKAGRNPNYQWTKKQLGLAED